MQARWLAIVLVVGLGCVTKDSSSDTGGGGEGEGGQDAGGSGATTAEAGTVADDGGASGGGTGGDTGGEGMLDEGPDPDVCADETRADDFEEGLVKQGGAGVVMVTLLSATPPFVVRGENEWVVRVDGQDGMPMVGVEGRATPFAPDHGTGTPVEPSVSPEPGEGELRIQDINLFLDGYWEVTLTVLDGVSGAELDQVVFKVCAAPL